MGDFAEAMTTGTGADPSGSGPVSQPTQPESSPDSSATSTGTAPSSPQSQQQTTSPSGVRTPQQPSSQSFDQGKQVDLRALHEARSQIKTFRDTYGWLPKDQVEAIRGFYTAYTRDPAGALLGEIQSLLEHPQARQRILSAFQQWGGSPVTNGQAGQSDPEPEPDYQLPDGKTFMSASRLAEWRAWHDRQNEQKLQETLAPIQNFVTDSQRAAVQAEARANATRFAERVFEEAKSWPHFLDNKPAIAAKFDEFSQRMNAESALYRAYLAVLHETVFPNLSRNERMNVKTELEQRARATTPNPTRTAGQRQDRKAESFRDAAERILGSRAAS